MLKPLPAGRSIVSESAAMKAVMALVDQVALTNATVLVLGETGVGKELVAQAIHDRSSRRKRAMTRVSCAAIPGSLLESELFGRERGAYTGADTRQIGRFEAADQSTIFLDEIGELSADAQVKLLRVIQEREIERLGGGQPIKVDIRVIAATHRDLDKAVAHGTFREDLYYRINVFPVVVPPLRERRDDIALLARQFATTFSAAMGKPLEAIAAESLDRMCRYDWPGNVRELGNLVERAVIVSSGPVLTIPVPTGRLRPLAIPTLTLRSVQTQHIRDTLASTNWRVRGRNGAADRLGLKPTTLETRMAKLGISRPGMRQGERLASGR
jgi:formate hydrogenlyase transcriptional activator